MKDTNGEGKWTITKVLDLRVKYRHRGNFVTTVGILRISSSILSTAVACGIAIQARHDKRSPKIQ